MSRRLVIFMTIIVLLAVFGVAQAQESASDEPGFVSTQSSSYNPSSAHGQRGNVRLAARSGNGYGAGSIIIEQPLERVPTEQIIMKDGNICNPLWWGC